jgi:hypothetical protein
VAASTSSDNEALSRAAFGADHGLEFARPPYWKLARVSVRRQLRAYGPERQRVGGAVNAPPCGGQLSAIVVSGFVLPQSLSALRSFLHSEFAIPQIARYFLSDPVGQFQYAVLSI